MTSFEFEKLVKQALMDLPEHIRKAIDNAAIVIEEKPPRKMLLGLYQGVPKTMWGRGFGQILPDKITIFQEPIENLARSEEEAKRTSSLLHLHPATRELVIKELIRLVVWHEIAHHLGFSEKKVRELEANWRKK